MTINPVICSSELGAKIEVLSEKDSSNWVVRKFNSDDTFTINKRMIEITKMNWKRNKSPEPNINPKNKAEKKKNRMATIWKEPDKTKNTYRQSRLVLKFFRVFSAEVKFLKPFKVTLQNCFKVEQYQTKIKRVKQDLNHMQSHLQ